MRTYLVTGGAGFIGSNFARAVLSAEPNAEVRNLDLLTYAGLEANVAELDVYDGHEFIHGDIRDSDIVDSAMSGVDVVVHFAAESHVDRSITAPDVSLSTNVVGTGIMLDAARRHAVPTFVHVSTDEVYGPVMQGTVDERATLRPSSPYAASKAAADLIVAAYRHTYGYAAIVTRCTNNYGPYQHPEKLIPLAITQALDAQSIPIYGSGKQERDWLWIDDHIAAIQLLVGEGKPGEVYNISCGVTIPNSEVVGKLIDLAGSGTIEHVADRPGHDQRYAIDSAKLRGLGWSPTVDIDTGLERAVAWYREHEDWWRPLVAQ